MPSDASTQIISQVCTQLDLSPNHGQVYLALIKHGQLTAGGLAKASGIARSSVYDILKALINQGLVSQTTDSGKQNFTAAPPSRLNELLEAKQSQITEQMEQLSQVLPNIESEYKSHQGQFPRMQFFEGVAGLKSVLYDSLDATEVLAICQGEEKGIAQLADEPKYLLDYIQEVDRRGIVFRELLEDHSTNREYVKRYRHLPKSKYDYILFTPLSPTPVNHVDKQIYDNRIAYISHDNLVGVIIEDDTLAEIERQQFEALWQFYKNRSKR